MRLIDADELERKVRWYGSNTEGLIPQYELLNAPTVKAIPSELYEQVKGERDVAIEQLKSLNIELFEEPYLKAIPIEWIEKFMEQYRTDLVVSGEYILLHSMLTEWETENALDKQIEKWEIDDDVDWEMIQNGEITD